MSREVLLAFSKEDAELAREYPGRVFAWTPPAVHALRKARVDFKTLSDIQLEKKFWGYDHVDLLCRFENWCSGIDRLLQDEIPELKAMNVRPFAYKLLAMRKVFFQYLNDYKKLKYVSEFYQSPLCYRAGPETEYLDQFASLGEFTIPLRCLNPESRASLPLGAIGHWYQEHGFIKQVGKFMLRDRKVKRLSDFLRALIGNRLGSKRPAILVINRGYDSDEIMRRMREQVGVDTIFWEDCVRIPSRPLIFNSASIQKRIFQEMKNHPWTVADGVDFLPFFEPLIRSTLEFDVRRLLEISHAFLEFDRKFRFSVVFAAAASTEGEAIFDQCDRLGIPTTLNLHGGSVGVYRDFAPMPAISTGYKRAQNSFYLVYSDLMKSYCDEVKAISPAYGMENVAVGSPQLDRLWEQFR